MMIVIYIVYLLNILVETDPLVAEDDVSGKNGPQGQS